MKVLNSHNNELDAWLHFIASDEPEIIFQIITNFPEFRELYEQVISFRYDIKEVLHMFSDALRILDENTTQYMIEELQKDINEKELQLNEKDSEIKEKDRKLELMSILMDANRLEDMKRANKDTKYLQTLYVEFNLNK